MRRTLLLWVLAALLTSCESAFYDLVSEKPTDPTASAPLVGAFDSLYGVPVSWDKDSYADEYVVYRRPLTSLTDLEVYRGAGLGFVDSTATVGTLYAYTLAKVRGSKTFSVGAQAFGAYSDVQVRDPNGANDTKDTALGFGTNTIGEQVSYFRGVDSKTGLSVELADRDWFYVDLGPRLQVYFVLNYDDESSDAGKLLLTGSVGSTVDSLEIYVFNPDVVSRRLWFCVQYNTSLTGTSEMIGYHLVFKSIQNYTP